MCGRFTYMFSWRQLHALLNLSNPGATLADAFDEQPFQASYNVAPSHIVRIVRQDADGKIIPAMAKWGLMPSWATKPGPINARAETVATLPMFRSAFATRRCIVPVGGFYEWQATGGKVKQPWHIRRADGAAMLLAGLWEPRPDGDTFAVITTAANEFVRQIHDRMPVVLEPESVAAWFASPDRARLRPAADGVLIAHKVSTRVNAPKNNDATLIEPV